MANIVFEFLGTARQKVDVREYALRANTVAEALATLQSQLDGVGGLVNDDGLLPYYRVVLNGEHAITDSSHTLSDGDRLVIISAEAGG